MPVADIARTASAMRTALIGHPMVRFDAPKLIGPVPQAGRMVETIEARGKHLEVMWDDGIVLDTHLKGKSEWHVYRQGSPVAAVVGEASCIHPDRRLRGGVFRRSHRGDVPSARSGTASRAWPARP